MSEPEIEERLAALGRRSDNMGVLFEMLWGQNERQRRELQEIRTILASTAKPTEPGQGVPEISPEMLG